MNNAGTAGNNQSASAAESDASSLRVLTYATNPFMHEYFINFCGYSFCESKQRLSTVRVYLLCILNNPDPLPILCDTEREM